MVDATSPGGAMEFGAANFLMKPPDSSYLNIPNLLSEEFSRQRSFLEISINCIYTRVFPVRFPKRLDH